jgi:hypothetical protein
MAGGWLRCRLPEEHEGDHAAGDIAWPDALGQVDERSAEA